MTTTLEDSEAGTLKKTLEMGDLHDWVQEGFDEGDMSAEDVKNLSSIYTKLGLQPLAINTEDDSEEDDDDEDDKEDEDKE